MAGEFYPSLRTQKRGYIALVVVLGNSRIWNRANVTRRIGTIFVYLHSLMGSRLIVPQRPSHPFQTLMSS